MRVVHESSERDIQARQVMDALTELAAQIMRLSAGAGNAARMWHALGRLNRAISEMRPVSPGLSHYEALEALQFTTDNPEEVDRSVDEIARHALRLVASRYGGLNIHEIRERREVIHACEVLERAREERRRIALSSMRASPSPPSPNPWDEMLDSDEVSRQSVEFSDLTAGIKRALIFLSTEDKAERLLLRRPNTGSLAALEKRGLIRKDDTAIVKFAVTEEGRRAFEAI